MKFHHIGVACSDIVAMIGKMKLLHPTIVSISDIIHDPLQGVDLCMICLEDNTCLELVSGKPVERFVQSKNSFYHICYEVPNLQEQLDHFISNGAVLISPPKPAILFHNREVAFVLTAYGIVELLASE